MRTTVELKPELRARLLELAARRGEKGFSSVLNEAIEAYLAAVAENHRLRRRALKLKGTLPKAQGEQLRRETSAIRASWR